MADGLVIGRSGSPERLSHLFHSCIVRPLVSCCSSAAERSSNVASWYRHSSDSLMHCRKERRTQASPQATDAIFSRLDKQNYRSEAPPRAVAPRLTGYRYESETKVLGLCWWIHINQIWSSFKSAKVRRICIEGIGYARRCAFVYNQRSGAPHFAYSFLRRRNIGTHLGGQTIPSKFRRI
jgi:hypothetical protein